MNKKEKIFNIEKYYFLKNKRKLKSIKFSNDEDKKLIKIKASAPLINWKEVAIHFNKSIEQCRKHWYNSLNPTLIKGKWSENEDSKIINWVKTVGPNNWGLVGIKGRNPKQIRERYHNYIKYKAELNSNNNNYYNKFCSHSKWSINDENKLIALAVVYNFSWTKVSNMFENTSQIRLKNKFYCLLRSYAKFYKDINVKKNLVNKKVCNRYSNIDPLVDFTKDNENNSKNNFDSNKLNKKRIFLAKSELLRYLPYMIEYRNLNNNINQFKILINKEDNSVYSSTNNCSLLSSKNNYNNIYTSFNKVDIDYMSKNYYNYLNRFNADLESINKNKDDNLSFLFSNLDSLKIDNKQIKPNIPSFEYCLSKNTSNELEELLLVTTLNNNNNNNKNLDNNSLFDLKDISQIFEFNDNNLTSDNIECLDKMDDICLHSDNKTKQKELALKKIIDSLSKRKLDIKRNSIMNQLKANLLYSVQVDVFQKIISKIKINALTKMFYLFKKIVIKHN